MKKMKHFGIEATSMEKYIRTYNPAAKMHWFHLPFAKTLVDINPHKEYDLVFFARITKMKGIEDAIYALAKAKQYKPDISMEVIGNADETYKKSLQKLVDDLGLKMNVTFKGFIPTQKEMHIEVLKARISVLPTYNDTIPGTIVESMLLGLPVISYKTGGIPDLNKDDENLILVEQGDIDGLAAEIIKLLNEPERQKKLGDKTKSFASEEFNNTNSAEMLVKAYKEVIHDYYN
jgi:glycosyltransferase involved in cell wall biosynthesis